jgi:CBS domain-containing protein
MEPRHVPTAGEIMNRKLVTLSPETPIFDAIAALLRHNISGAPVVGADGELLGLLSEYDCLRVLASGEFYEHGYYAAGTVADLMTQVSHSISPDLDLYGIAHAFITLRVRRLPVIEDGRLVGQVSRRDVLRAVEGMRLQRAGGKRYPDYPKDREPMP